MGQPSRNTYQGTSFFKIYRLLKEKVNMDKQSLKESNELEQESQDIVQCLEPEVVVESVWVKQEKLDFVEDEEYNYENEGNNVEGSQLSLVENVETVTHKEESFQDVGSAAKPMGSAPALPYQSNLLQQYLSMHRTPAERIEGKHKCKECSYSTNVAGRLKAHAVTHTGDRPFKCRLCPYSSSMAGTLKRHVATHTGHRPYKCPVCPYSGGQPGNLKRHLATHTVIKPYHCPECSYSSATVSTLKIHMKTHTGIRPFECPLCPYRSSRTSTLRIHMVTHTGHKPYQCSQCNFKTSEARILRRHMAVHSPEAASCDVTSTDSVTKSVTTTPAAEPVTAPIAKIFLCQECDFTCSYKYTLKRHMMWKHDGLRPYGCAHCDYGSMSKQSLVTHLAKYHKNDMM